MFTPTPDPAPHTGTRPVTYAPYVYVVPAVNRRTHRLERDVWFACHVHRNGSRACRISFQIRLAAAPTA